MHRPNHTGAARAPARAERLEERIVLSVFIVTNTTDDADVGSLRRAIIDANASVGPDEIRFDPAVFSTPRTITIVSPPTPPQIQGALTITGPGASLLTINRTGGRVLESFASTLAISGVTISGGSGGGLRINGVSPDCTLDSVVFTGNFTTEDGGGVALTNNATLTVRNSVFTNNTARLGGGIFFFQGGSLVMDNCTLSGNAATGFDGHNNSGGGIYFSGTARPTPPPAYTPNALVVRNSTFSGNTAARGGGGMSIDGLTGTFFVQNTTISGNTAGTSGGGIGADAGTGTITLQDTTVTDNTANGAAPANGGGGISRTSLVANTLNVINSVVSGNHHPASPDIRTDAFTTTNVNSSAVGSASGFSLSGGSSNNLPFGVNPLLGALANNGGRTLTHAVLAGSPLINAGSNGRVPAELVFDQRGPGFPRIVGSAVDIGAYEREAVVNATVVGRSLFYNHSSFDGNDAAANAADDAARAPDKRARLAGAATSFANVSSYDKGINGVIVDVAGLPRSQELTAADFDFGPARPPVSVTVRPGAGVNGSDRVSLIWTDYSPGSSSPTLAVANGWLTVTVHANPHTGLTAPDVFSFGSLIGESGDGTGASGWRVNALDLSAVKRSLNAAAPVASAVDFNRDGRINALDLAIVKRNLNRSLGLV